MAKNRNLQRIRRAPKGIKKTIGEHFDGVSFVYATRDPIIRDADGNPAEQYRDGVALAQGMKVRDIGTAALSAINAKFERLEGAQNIRLKFALGAALTSLVTNPAMPFRFGRFVEIGPGHYPFADYIPGVADTNRVMIEADPRSRARLARRLKNRGDLVQGWGGAKPQPQDKENDQPVLCASVFAQHFFRPKELARRVARTIGKSGLYVGNTSMNAAARSKGMPADDREIRVLRAACAKQGLRMESMPFGPRSGAGRDYNTMFWFIFTPDQQSAFLRLRHLLRVQQDVDYKEQAVLRQQQNAAALQKEASHHPRLKN